MSVHKVSFIALDAFISLLFSHLRLCLDDWGNIMNFCFFERNMLLLILLNFYRLWKRVWFFFFLGYLEEAEKILESHLPIRVITKYFFYQNVANVGIIELFYIGGDHKLVELTFGQLATILVIALFEQLDRLVLSNIFLQFNQPNPDHFLFHLSVVLFGRLICSWLHLLVALILQRVDFIDSIVTPDKVGDWNMGSLF